MPPPHLGASPIARDGGLSSYVNRLSRALLAAVLVATVASAAEERFARALDLPAGSAELRAMAAAASVDALCAALSDSDAARRQGAARLLAYSDLPAERLLSVLLASADPEVRRLGVLGLRRGLAGIAPEKLLELGPAGLVAPLLAMHPTPFANPQVHTAVAGWLADPATCADAALVVAARGVLAGWGDALVALVAADSSAATVVRTAHRTLEQLTRTQRSLDAYAGHRDLAAKDWRDRLAALAAQAPATQTDTAVLELIAQLPNDEALIALLERGPAVVSAIETMMAGAERGRRRELAAAARLLARGVTPGIWRALGASGLEDLDAADVRARLACLRRCAEAIKAKPEPRGPLHLIIWLDDRDPAVRASALDRLVRLSDDKEQFKGNWRFGDDSLFPTAQVSWRLRRSLRQGSHDEQLAALLLIASLKATTLSDDVTGLLLSSDGVVVDAAMEGMGHLTVRDQDLLVLARLASDRAQPAQRRAKACALIGKYDDNRSMSWSSDRSRKTQTESPTLVETVAMLERLITDPDPLVAKAARAALASTIKDVARKLVMFRRLLDGDDALQAIDLLKSEDDPKLIWLLIPLLASERADVAKRAALALGGAVQRRYSAGVELRKALVPRLQEIVVNKSQVSYRLVAIAIGTGDRAAMLAELPTMVPEDRDAVWDLLVSSCPRSATALAALAAVAMPLDEGKQHDLIRRALAIAGLTPKVLDALIATDNEHMLETLDQNSSSADGVRTQTIDLGTADKLVLSGKKRADAGDDDYSGSSYAMVVTSRPAGLPEEGDLPALVEALARVEMVPDTAARRALVTAICGGPLPDAATAAADTRLWSVLIHLRPEARQIMLAALAAGKPADWDLELLIQLKNPDLLPYVVATWADQPEWDREKLGTWLTTLPADQVRPMLAQLLSDDKSLTDKTTATLLRTFAPLPLPLALRLLAINRLSYPVAPYEVDAATALATALTQLNAGQVLRQASSLRRIRVAAPTVFDPVLAKMATRNDRIGASWLRSGLPMDAGLKDAYDAAFSSDEPHRWVVGAALRLKDGRLTPGEFLARVPQLPPTAQSDAALAASRSLSGKCADQGTALAAILDIAVINDLSTWIGLCPPDPSVEAALARRMQSSGMEVAQALAVGLAARMRSDNATWKPIIERLDVPAKGRLRALVGLPSVP